MAATVQIGYLADHPSFTERLAAWHFEAFGRLTPGDSITRRIELLRKRANRRAIPTVIVAMLDSELVGSATLAEYDMETRRDLTPWMTDVFVAPEFRRRSIASALVRRIVDEARALDVAELYLFTTGAMREGLYAGLGWVVIDRPIYRDAERVLMSIRA
jgi:GNAT superfamily N-acetyltransferase